MVKLQLSSKLLNSSRSRNLKGHRSSDGPLQLGGTTMIMNAVSRPDKSPSCDKNYPHVLSVPADLNDFEVWLGCASPGEDFFTHLLNSGQDVKRALKAWSIDLSRQSALLECLAERLDGIHVERIHAHDRPDFAHIAASDETGRQVLIEAVHSGLLTFSDYEECAAGKGFHVLEK